LTIIEAEAEMHKAPNELCPTVADSVKKIVGLSIASGFSDQVRKRLSGVVGCSHLTHLILAMGPAVLHGFWAQQTRKPLPVPGSFEEVPGLPYLINCCRLWKEDGPLVERLHDFIERTKDR